MYVVGVCGPADFSMALDNGAGGSIEREHLAFALSIGEPDAESHSLPAAVKYLRVLHVADLLGWRRLAQRISCQKTEWSSRSKVRLEAPCR